MSQHQRKEGLSEKFHTFLLSLPFIGAIVHAVVHVSVHAMGGACP